MAWKLVDNNGKAVKVGDNLTRINEYGKKECYAVCGMRPPHKPSSCGFIHVRRGRSRLQSIELYVTVFDLKFVEVV